VVPLAEPGPPQPVHTALPVAAVNDAQARHLRFERTARASPVEPLLLGIRHPYAPLTSETIAKIALKLMTRVPGLDTSLFKPHSLRGAVATRMLDLGNTLSDVLRLGRWKSFSAFDNYYNRQSSRVDVLSSLTAPPGPLVPRG